MRWLRFFIIVQAVLIFVFIIVFMFQSAEKAKEVDPYANSTSTGGYLPSTTSTLDMSKFSKGAFILLVVTVLELIIITKTFK